MQLKIETKIEYVGEDMKKHLLMILDLCESDYMIDETERVITVFEKSQPKRNEAIIDNHVNHLLEVLIESPLFLRSWEETYPSLLGSSKNPVSKLTNNQKIEIITDVINNFTKRHQGVYMRRINMCNDILSVIFKYYDIQNKESK